MPINIQPPTPPQPPSPLNRSPMERKSAEPVQKDSSIFHGKQEITRGEFRNALRKNYQGSGMSPSERLRIEKRNFPSIYGPNISKADMQNSLQKLSQKILGSKDPEEIARIRKDINYLKRLIK